MDTDIIVDCDPGHDDAIALLLANASDNLNIKAITTVAGNQTIAKTTRNARQVMTLAGNTDVPIAAGMANPMFRDLVIGDFVHGESGLDGPALPDPGIAVSDKHAVDMIIDMAHETDGITLVPTGPLTNVGMALRREPAIADNIEEIVLMGGGVQESNITPTAEFNIYVDPEAASLVFKSDIPVTMIGLDVTHQSRCTQEEIDRLREHGTEVARIVADLHDYAKQYSEEIRGWEGYPIHDAVAVGHLIDSSIVETEYMNVVVETNSKYGDGQTVCDQFGVTDREPNTHVGVDLDRDRFIDLLFEAIKSY
ncbi:MAG: nucleoside hydrolase [Halobacteriaceae archaeon]